MWSFHRDCQPEVTRVTDSFTSHHARNPRRAGERLCKERKNCKRHGVSASSKKTPQLLRTKAARAFSFKSSPVLRGVLSPFRGKVKTHRARVVAGSAGLQPTPGPRPTHVSNPGAEHNFDRQRGFGNALMTKCVWHLKTILQDKSLVHSHVRYHIQINVHLVHFHIYVS